MSPSSSALKRGDLGSAYFAKLVEVFRDYARLAMEKLGFVEAKPDLEREEAFFQLLVALMASMVKADGVVDAKELAFVQHYLESRFNFTEDRRHSVHVVFEEALSVDVNPVQYAKEMVALYPGPRVLLECVLEILVHLSVVDGVLSESEYKMLKTVAKALHLTECVQPMRDFAFACLNQEPEKQYRYLLCVSPAAPLPEATELKHKYDEQLKRYDVRELKKQGMPENFELFINNRIDEIRQAYALLT